MGLSNRGLPGMTAGMTVTKDLFAHKAGEFDQNPRRVENVANIAAAIRAAIPLHRSQGLLDFGAGTGLLLAELAPGVGHITAVEVSPAMAAQLREKLPGLGCPVTILTEDLTAPALPPGLSGLDFTPFDGIVSSMTLHHIADIPGLLARFYQLLQPGGFIALADLDAEDGSFHSEDTGVFHPGFARETLAAQARAAGFTQVTVGDASVIRKPQGDYPVFLLTGRR